MEKILENAKGIAALVGAILTSVMAILPETPLWLKITAAVVTTIAVFTLPDKVTPEVKEAIIQAEVEDPDSPVQFAPQTRRELREHNQ